MSLFRKLAVLITAVTSFCFGASSSAADLDADWAELQSVLAPIKGVCTTQPTNVVTNKYTAGMLLGNGEIGVVVGDTLTSQKFYFGKSDFLGIARNERQNRWENSILPIGSLRISSPQTGDEPASVFRMEQDVLHAEVRTTMRLGPTVVNMRSWTADSDNVFVTELRSAADAQPVVIDLALSENESTLYPRTAGASDDVLWVTRQASSANPTVSTTAATAPGVGGDLSNIFTSRVALAMKIVSAKLENTVASNGTASARLTLRPGQPARIVVAVRGDAGFGERSATVESLRDAAATRIANLDDVAIDKLSTEHLDWWKDFWLKSYVSLHDDVLEKYYYGALYVMGCSARPGHVLPSMFGMWITNDSPAWGARHFFNYNAQAPYYGVASSNRPELVLPYADFVVAELPYQVNRTASAGYKGATFTRSYAPYNVFRAKPPGTPVAPEKDWERLPTDQKSNGTFGVLPMLTYYEYTRDEQFLRDKLYPTMKTLDAFWRDYIDREELPNGTYRYVINHTGCHEFPNAAAATDVNANLDIGFIRTQTRALIDASKTLGVDQDLVPVWQDVLDHLSAFPVGTFEGKECYQTAEVRGRNPASTRPARLLEPDNQPVNMEGAVHPAENVGLGCGDEHAIQVGLNSLEVMHSWGLRGGSQNNGFCKVWPIAARLGWPAEDFVEKFRAAILHLWRESNLTCFQGGGGIETSGSIDAVNAMLLQSSFGEMRVFPVWPANRDASFKRLRAKGAFLVSSAIKDGRVTHVDIASERGGGVKLLNPWGADATIDATDPSGKTIPADTSGDYIRFDTTGGSRYVLRPR